MGLKSKSPGCGKLDMLRRDGKTVPELAEMFGVCRRTIAQWTKVCGISAKRGRPQKEVVGERAWYYRKAKQQEKSSV